ncbi:MAG: UvrD-helicase domain-containing protein [Actinomycetota bacterium]
MSATTSISPAVRATFGGHEPSSEQFQAITHELVPLAIIAGAGSGKTAVMAARIVWMIEGQTLQPSQILGLTFTNKAARELQDRISAACAEMAPRPREEPQVATYHSFADSLVREHGVRIGVDPEVGLLSEAQRWQLLLSELDRLPAFDVIESRSVAMICRMALGLADQCANHLLTPEMVIAQDERILRDAVGFSEEVIATSRRRIELAGVVRAYLDAKQRAQRIDFGDQVTKAVEILERFPSVAADLRQRYRAILLDEYQDTNVAQRRLMQLLAPEGYNLTAVGDARQNIFQWRGSTLFNLIDFPARHFLRAGGKAHGYLSLSQNFRSGARILDLANRLIDSIPQARRPGKALAADPRHGEGWVGVKQLGDQLEEASYIAEEIQRLHGAPARPGRDPARWSDFAILLRRRAHIAAVYDALCASNIPVEVVGLGGLLALPEVMDVVAWLRVLADPGPGGNRWLARILLGPRFRVHYRDLVLLARWAASRNRELAVGGAGGGARGAKLDPEEVAYSLTEALAHLDEIEGLAPEAARRLAQARAELSALRPRTPGPLLDLVQEVATSTGIAEVLDVVAGTGSGWANLTNFLGLVANFAPVSGEPSLPAFLAYLDAAEEVEETMELAALVTDDSVKLMTVHQAKGLEFEVVFVPAVAARRNESGDQVSSVFPDERISNPMISYGQLPYPVREDAEHLPKPWLPDGQPQKKAEFGRELRERAVEDERRLFYVALTRAKQRLYVTAAWWYLRQSRPHGPSLFWEEVAAAPETEVLPGAEMPDRNPLLARLSERATWPPDPPHLLYPDPVFPESYPVALEALMSGELSAEELLSRLEPPARTRAEALIEQHRRMAAAVAETGRKRPADLPGRGLPATLSVTRAVDLAAGRLSRRELMRPLPARPEVSRRIGVEVHRWIEEQARIGALMGLADEEILDIPATRIQTARLAEIKAGFKSLGYGERRLARLDTGEVMAELPFVLKVGGCLIRGRMDAVYECDDGGLEIVDFKTGSASELDKIHQLALYAAALIQLGVDLRGPLRVTYCYLSTGTQDSRTLEPAEAQRALSDLTAALEMPQAGETLLGGGLV